MAPKRKYIEGEKILCYHGPLLYEAKCLQVDLTGKQVKYLVHYNGWNKNWDEWVGESRMLKYAEVNLQKQEELKKQYIKEKKPKGKVQIKKEPISEKEESSPVIKKEAESSEKKKCSIQESFSVDKNKSPKGNIILKKKVIVTITKDKGPSLSSETKKTLTQKKSEKQTHSKTDSTTKVKKGKDDGHTESAKKVITKSDKGTPKQSSLKSDSSTKIKKLKDDSAGSTKKEVKKTDKLKQTTHKETVKQTSVKKEHPVKIKKEKDEDSSTNKEAKKKSDKEKQIAQKEAQKQTSAKKVPIVRIKKEVEEKPNEEKSVTKEIKKVSTDKGKQILKGETLKQGTSENKPSADETAKKKCAEKLTETKEETAVQQRKSQRQSVLEKYKTSDDKAAQSAKSVKSKAPAKEIPSDQTKSLKQKPKHGVQNLDGTAKNSSSQKHSAKKRSRHSSLHMSKKKRWKRFHKRRKRTYLKNKKFPKDGAKFEVMFNFPQSLTNWIIDDWHQVNELKKLLHLPARITADHFIEVYRRLKIKLLMLEENSDRHLIVEATCNGLRNHFNTILGNRLLYRFERIQYADILEKFKGIQKCKIYGAIHLLRMLSSMEKYITENNEILTDMQLITLNKSVQDFITVMEKPFQFLLSADDYEVASPEYHRRALI